MSDYKKFKKIGQFKDVIHSLRSSQQYTGKDENGIPQYDKSIIPTGKITFTGTVKLHGSNGNLVYDVDTEELTAGKRTSEVGVNGGHMGFADWVYHRNQDRLKRLLRILCGANGFKKVSVFGEWAGQGIQKTVAISELPKAFYAVAIWVHDNSEDGGFYAGNEVLKGFATDESIGFFNIMSFPTYEVEVDVEFPALAVDKLNELTEAVDKECPVAKQRAEKEGLKLYSKIGEGIVFSDEGKSLHFKCKGPNHSKGVGSSKMATLDPIKAKGIQDFVAQTVTEDRLEQCWQTLEQEVGEITRKHTGDFIRWMVSDVVAEEGDGMHASGLERSDIGKYISTTSRAWMFKKIDSDFDRYGYDIKTGANEQ